MTHISQKNPSVNVACLYICSLIIVIIYFNLIIIQRMQRKRKSSAILAEIIFNLPFLKISSKQQVPVVSYNKRKWCSGQQNIPKSLHVVRINFCVIDNTSVLRSFCPMFYSSPFPFPLPLGSCGNHEISEFIHIIHDWNLRKRECQGV